MAAAEAVAGAATTGDVAASSGTLDAIATHATPGARMVERGDAELRPGVGVVGDVPGRAPGREVTVVDSAAWRSACAELGQEVPWTARRANLLVTGIDLRDAAGCELRIGAARLRVTGETLPCRIMDRQRAGLRSALEADWRGGATCTVLTGGAVAVGDGVELIRPSS